MATLLSNFVWEGLPTEMAAVEAYDGHIYKQLDTGESYIHRDGAWQYINLGLSFVKATKSGTATTNPATGTVSITFNTPFIDADYSVALSCDYDPAIDVAIAYKYNKTTTGFDIIVRDAVGNPVDGDSVTVSWLCTRDYNP